MRLTRTIVWSVAAGVAAALMGSADLGAAIAPGNLVVVRAGDGSAALSSVATATYLQEFTTAGGSPVQTIPLPIVVSGSNKRLTLSGTATSEGYIAISTNAQYLTMAGYDAAPGTANPSTAVPTTINRVVGRIDMLGNIDTTTALTDAYNGSNIRSAVSTDGTDIWTSGNAGTGQGATAGTRYTTLGSTTSTQLHSTNTNMRVANIYAGQLYGSSSSSSLPLYGVATVGTGLPTTSGQTLTQLPGFPTASGPSSYDFWFLDSSTLYVADDRTNGLGGVQKWTFDGSTWSLQYTLATSLANNTGARGLAGTTDGLGNAVLYATTTETSANRMITITDLGIGSPFTTLATAPTNTAFRGVEFIVPEPSSALVIALAGAALLARRREG